MLKPHKNEGVSGLSSDFFINACDELYVHLAMLISAMLVHGFSPTLLSISTIIPIPKGHSVSKNNSANYRAISMSSVICKIIDLIIINKYGDRLFTSANQFGFKRKSSTDMCTMLLKETISYYHEQSSDVYCTFLDATKAFDRVHYCKLFNVLLDRHLPVVFLRLLFTMYTSHSAFVSWNGVLSNEFQIKNGVRQGGILSPILFGIYIDGLLQKLINAKVGCFIGNAFLGVLAYADDLALIAPTPSAMRKLLSICDAYGHEYSVSFNASKSKCIYFNAGVRFGYCYDRTDVLPKFMISGHSIEYVHKWPHLGHIISSKMSDSDDIIHRRNEMIRQVNDVLCYFGKLDGIIKLKLLYSYGSSFYGSSIWDLTCYEVAALCVSWRSALKRVWKLPMNAHSDILYNLCGNWPLELELKYRILNFSVNCLNSDNFIVKFVTRNALLCLYSSIFAKNFFICHSTFHLNFYFADLDHLYKRITKYRLSTEYYYSKFINDTCRADELESRTWLLFELISIRDGSFSLSNFGLADIRAMIYDVCTS